MNDRHLQRDFEGKIFNIDGIKRECYYCTYEDGGAWIWLRTLFADKCRQINFVIRDKYKLEDLYRQVSNGEVISEKEYGYLSMQS